MEMQLSLTDVDTTSNETFVKTAKSRKCSYQNCDMQISLWSHAEYLRSVKISKRGKVRRSDTRPGDVRERAARVEGNDSAPVRKAPVSPCKPLCAIFLRKPSVYALSPVKANVGRLCEKLKSEMKSGWGIKFMATTLPDFPHLLIVVVHREPGNVCI